MRLRLLEPHLLRLLLILLALHFVAILLILGVLALLFHGGVLAFDALELGGHLLNCLSTTCAECSSFHCTPFLVLGHTSSLAYAAASSLERHFCIINTASGPMIFLVTLSGTIWP